MKRLIFETDQFYHIYNRGMEKHVIFRDVGDYLRFLNILYYFNDAAFNPENFKYQGQTLISYEGREELVEIIAWCLMPNHYHLILRQKVEGGIRKFMQRIGTGYTVYNNLKYERSGHLFQGPFKSKHIDSDSYLLHVTRYVHLNPLELKEPGWKEQGIKNIEAGKQFVLAYPWSSLHNYLADHRFSLLIEPGEFWRIFEGNAEDYKNFLWEWLTTGVPSHMNFVNTANIKARP